MGVVQLGIVRSCKHVGSMQDSGGSPAPEMALRAWAAKAALAESMKLLKDLIGGFAPKVLVVKAMVFSRMFYNACTWYNIPSSSFLELSILYVRSYRRAFNCLNGPVDHIFDSGISLDSCSMHPCVLSLLSILSGLHLMLALGRVMPWMI